MAVAVKPKTTTAIREISTKSTSGSLDTAVSNSARWTVSEEMQLLIIADIHANLTALEAVLADAERRGKVDGVWCLGDIVGYGPDPRACIALIREVCAVCVAGNHDLAASGRLETTDFSQDAANAALWTAQHLTPADKDYLDGLPLVIQQSEFTLVHGTPRDPIWQYMFSLEVAEENLPHFGTPYCMVGHTHIPVAFEFSERQQGTLRTLEHEGKIRFSTGKVIVNPGAVGQPRDSDPRASYGIYDADQKLFTLCRVPYDILSVQDRMWSQGLPGRLIARLETGT